MTEPLDAKRKLNGKAFVCRQTLLTVDLKVTLPKFHVYIEYADGKEKPSIRFNLSPEEIVRTFATPFASGKPFLFCNRLLNPAKVQKAIIFCSQEEADKLVLPNREEVANHPDKKFVVDYILRGKVRGVQVCTEKFLPSLEKKE